MNNYGIKVVKAGADITSTDIRDQIMNSEYSMFKQHSDGTASATISAGGTVAYGTITHNLGYVPAFLAYTNDLFLPTRTEIVPSISVGTATPNWYPSVYADSTNIIVKYNFPTPYGESIYYVSDLYESGLEDGGQWAAGNFSGAGISGALRFTGVTLSGGDSIVSASINVIDTTMGTSTLDAKMQIYGIDEDNTGDFSSSPLGRTRTTAMYSQSQSKISGGFTLGINVKTCLEEIIARGGWSSGNAMGFLTLDDSSPTSASLYSESWDTTLNVIKTSSGTVNFRVIIFKDKIV